MRYTVEGSMQRLGTHTVPSNLHAATDPGHLPLHNSASLLPGEEDVLLTMFWVLSRDRCCGGILRYVTT